jgi:ADP-heptose:LPS heptosyltransferase
MQPAVPGTVIIFHIGSIGDTVVMLPCLHAIARHFPDQRRILLTNKPDSARASSAESVLGDSGLIHGAQYYPAGLGSPAAALSLVRRLRSTGARTLVYLAPRTTIWQVRRDLPFFRLAGIRRFLGLPENQRALQRRVDPEGNVEPEARYLARKLSRDILVDLATANWDLKLSAVERTVAEEHLAALPPGLPRVALAPGAKWASKDWGEARWTQLLQQLRARTPHICPVLLGAADEHALARRILSQWNGPALNLCGALSARESAAVLGRCGVLVCHDSGPMHLAATQGTPCVALFGNLNLPRQWFPWGDQHHVIHEARGVTFISVAEVADAVSERVDELAQVAPSRARHLYLVRS